MSKIVGLTFDNKLSWNSHIENIVKKASKRLYFLSQLKRAKIPTTDLVLFYITCVRSVVDYALPVFHYALPKYLIEELERIQKRAMAISFPGISYNNAINIAKIPKLEDHHKNMYICTKLFNEINNNKDYVLHELMPERHQPSYSLRKSRQFILPKTKTKRLMNNSFFYQNV